MKVKEIENLLKKLRWNTLQRMYGCSHSSIIGFISSEWINISPSNSIMDTAPSPKTGKGRKGQKNSDILLFEKTQPAIPVEVETNSNNYNKKIKTLFEYLNNKKNFEGMQFGLLVMADPLANPNRLEQKEINQINKKASKNKIIVLISIKREENIQKDTTPLTHLRNRYFTYQKDIVTVNYQILNGKKCKKERSLWKTQIN